MELHDAFRTWVVSGERDPLPRDIAVHASACPDCLRTAGAFDALAYVDAGAAPELPLQAVPRRSQRTALSQGGRVAAGLAAVALIGAAGFVAANGLMPRTTAQSAAGAVTETPEGVLGGIFDTETPAASSSPGASVDGSANASASTDAEASPTSAPAGGPTPPPSFGVLPTPPPGPTSSGSPSSSATPASLRPSAGTSATPAPTPPPTTAPTPTPTLVPTPTPTPEPTPTPTPVPTPEPTPQCSDGIDNDGDLLIDLLDPGCTSPDDDDEGGFILP